MEEEPKIMLAVQEAVHHTANGSVIEIGTYGNLNPDERTDIIADAYGVRPDQVVTEGDVRAKGARLSVGFRKWRSSWDPHANNINPNLN